jgi:hypothetical protein
VLHRVGAHHHVPDPQLGSKRARHAREHQPPGALQQQRLRRHRGVDLADTALRQQDLDAFEAAGIEGQWATAHLPWFFQGVVEPRDLLAHRSHHGDRPVHAVVRPERPGTFRRTLGGGRRRRVPRRARPRFAHVRAP